ncbi:MAG: hypothetical protein MI824_08715, partial [Hyphomicrobiales bacterium]|nr:hypothetical protein [Hyphomicrobiales bacterium]
MAERFNSANPNMLRAPVVNRAERPKAAATPRGPWIVRVAAGKTGGALPSPHACGGKAFRINDSGPDAGPRAG